MARKREGSPWDRVPGWLDADIGAVLAHLHEAFEAARPGVHTEEPLPDGRWIGEVAARACDAVRKGGVPGSCDLSVDVAVTLGTVLDNGWQEFRPEDGTERHGTLAEAARSAASGMPGPAA